MKLIHKTNIKIINPIDYKEYKVLLFENNNYQGEILNDINGNFYSLLIDENINNKIFLLKFRHIPNNKENEYILEMGLLKQKLVKSFLNQPFGIIKEQSLKELMNKIIYKI